MQFVRIIFSNTIDIGILLKANRNCRCNFKYLNFLLVNSSVNWVKRKRIEKGIWECLLLINVYYSVDAPHSLLLSQVITSTLYAKLFVVGFIPLYLVWWIWVAMNYLTNTNYMMAFWYEHPITSMLLSLYILKEIWSLPKVILLDISFRVI